MTGRRGVRARGRDGWQALAEGQNAGGEVKKVTCARPAAAAAADG